jgi:glycosyltransferase involved in cell wall biosynthesis
VDRVLRILSLNYEFPPIGGGGGNAHRHILQQFTHFSDLDITLLTSTTHPEPYSEEYSGHVRILFLPLDKESLHYWRRREVLRYLWTHHRFLKKHLREHTYDLCHVFFGFPCGLLAYQFRKHFPYIVSIRGSDVPGYNQRFALDYILLAPALRRIYHHSARVVANSTGLKKLFEQSYHELRARVIPNGIDTDRFHPQPKNPDRPVQLVTMARLIPRKGLDLLINACAELQNRQRDFRCHIIGEGPEEEPLKELARKRNLLDRVLFHGRLEREQVKNLLPQCDIFVLPSYAEGMSNAALEAMACGLPLVLSDTGGTQELIQSNGVIFQPGNQYALNQKLLDLVQHPRKIELLGEQSRRHAQNFTWRRVAEQYHALYLEVMQEKSTHGRI